MRYFNSDFFEFFDDLALNNHKEWFHQNKALYERSVKNPFEKFITDVIAEIGKSDSEMNITAKECILRINKDIRFSADKSPYNLHCTAFVSKAGGKDKSFPGLFLRFSTESIGIMGGCYSPSKEQLAAIRDSIVRNKKSFGELIKAKSFTETFKEIRGEKVKKISPELQKLADEESLVLNKQFYFFAERETALVESNELLSEIMNYWKAAKGINQFLEKAIETVSVETD